MRLIDDPWFAEIRPWIKVKEYGRGPKLRFELYNSTPKPLLWKALAGKWPCVTCGEPLHCFRQRHGKTRSVYVSVTCELPDNMSCARTVRKSSPALEALAEAIRG